MVPKAKPMVHTTNYMSINIGNAIYGTKIGFEEDVLYHQEVAKMCHFSYHFSMTTSCYEGVAFLPNKRNWDMPFLSR
jgi:hypothetical protein